MQELEFLDGEKSVTYKIPENIKELTNYHYEMLQELEDETDPGEILIKVYGIPDEVVDGTSIESLENWLEFHTAMLMQFDNLREQIEEELKEMEEGIVILDYYNFTSPLKLDDVKYGIWKNFEKVIDTFGEEDFTKLVRYTLAVFLESDSEEYNGLSFDDKARCFYDMSFFDSYKYFTFFLTNSKRYAKFINQSLVVQSMMQFTPEQESMNLLGDGGALAIYSNLQNTLQSLKASTDEETQS